jgi:hypothetical protein
MLLILLEWALPFKAVSENGCKDNNLLSSFYSFDKKITLSPKTFKDICGLLPKSIIFATFLYTKPDYHYDIKKEHHIHHQPDIGHAKQTPDFTFDRRAR